MIISRAPLRISLGGGGTDLPSYYEKCGGFLIAGAINKYIFVGANKQFYDYYLLKYSETEKVKNVHDIKHPLIREAINLVGVDRGIEITSLADIPARTGLGSSGSFLVCLLNTLHEYKGDQVTKRQIAEEACKIELEILKEHEGKQDKYACAFGGVKGYTFHEGGKVSVASLTNEDMIIHKLKNRLLLFFTGIQRNNTASSALQQQDEKCKQNNKDMFNKLDEIKTLGVASQRALEKLDFDCFGSLLNNHWIIKKKYSRQSTNKKIDSYYNFALEKGALGGKMIGAPGGGFLLLYFPEFENKKEIFIKQMEDIGLHHIPYEFDNLGVTTISKEEIK